MRINLCAVHSPVNWVPVAHLEVDRIVSESATERERDRALEKQVAVLLLEETLSGKELLSPFGYLTASQMLTTAEMFRIWRRAQSRAARMARRRFRPPRVRRSLTAIAVPRARARSRRRRSSTRGSPRASPLSDGDPPPRQLASAGGAP